MSNEQPTVQNNELTQPKDTKQTRAKKAIWNQLWFFIVAVAVGGPLALPILWRNPEYRLSTKLAVSGLVLALTAALIWVSGDLMTKALEMSGSLNP